MAEVQASLTEAEIDKMWGYIGDQRRGWKLCQVRREGRFDLTQVCNNGAVPGEKYCREHMPRIPSRVFWFVIGAAMMGIAVRFNAVNMALWATLALFLVWIVYRIVQYDHNLPEGT